MRLAGLMLGLLVLVTVSTPAHAAMSTASAGMFTSKGALPAIRSDAKVEVDGAFADVTITQTFRNDLDKGVEAVYVFPLPGDAAVRSMVIKTGDATITASIERRAEARAAYEDAVAAGAVAALTEEERANVFTQQITGIASGDEVTVELRFDMTVGRTATGWELVLPLVVAPRHVPGTATGKPTRGTGTSVDTDQVDDASRITPPVRGDKGGNPVTVAIDLGDVDGKGVVVPSHDADVATRRGHTTVAVKDARSDRDLVVRWTGAKKGAAEVIGERADEGGVVALVLETPRPGKGERKHRRWLLALDDSGSMDGDALLLMKAAARAVVDAAGTDSVALLAADGSATWHDGKGLKKVRAAIDALTADGSTELGALIDRALEAARSAGKGDDVAIILISDGLVADDAAVAARVDGSQRVHVIGVGAAPNRWLLDELARRGQGAAIVLGAGDDDPDAAVADLVAAAAVPAVTPEIDWGNLAVRDVVPAALPALAAGRSLVIAAHVDSFADATIRVHAGTATMKTKLVAADARKGALVARRWARARVDELVAAGGDSEVIAQLGLAHGLVTPYTALVARGQRVTVEGGVRTTVAIPVAMPAGMRWQAVFGPGGASTGAGGDAGGEVPTYTTTESPTPDGAGATDRESDEDAEESVQMAPGSYDSEVILLNGRVIMERRWTGELSLNTGLYVRGDERGAHVGVSGAAYRSVTRTWKVGALAKLQDAPSVEHGVDLAAYLTVRRVIAVGYQPILAVDGGLGASLDERGFAWRVALRLGPWAFAPAFVFDQSLGGDATRSSVGVGLGWSW